MVPPATTRTPAPCSAPDWTDSTRDSSIAIAEPGAAFGEDLGEVAAGGERASEDALGDVRVDQALAHAFAFVPATSIRRPAATNSSAPESESAAWSARAAPRVIEAGEGPPGDAAAAHVGGGLVGVAGDPVEEDAVRLRRCHPPSPASPDQFAQDRAHVEEEDRGEGEAVGDGDARQAVVAQGEDLALLGRDVDLLDRLVAGPVGDS